MGSLGLRRRNTVRVIPRRRASHDKSSGVHRQRLFNRSHSFVKITCCIHHPVTRFWKIVKRRKVGFLLTGNLPGGVGDRIPTAFPLSQPPFNLGERGAALDEQNRNVELVAQGKKAAAMISLLARCINDNAPTRAEFFLGLRS